MNLRRSLLAAVAFSLVLAVPHAKCQSSGESDIGRQLGRAAEYLRAGNANSAAEAFRAVLRLDPNNVEAHANLGVIAFFQNNFQGAADQLRTALSLDPSLVKVQALLGICEHKLGDPSAQLLLEQSLPRLTDKNVHIQAGLELANLYYQNGSLDRAAGVMQSLVDVDPDNVEVLFMTHQVHAELADETLNKLAIVAPGSARMQQIIAERLINTGDLPQAIQHYKKSLEINPTLPGLHFELAEAILQADPSDASAQTDGEHELQLAIKTDGDSAKIECAMARMALGRSDVAAAYSHFVRALDLNPQSVDAQLGVARMLMSKDQPEEALKHLKLAVEADPLNSEAHYRLAAAYRKLGRDGQSRQEAALFEEIKQTKSRVRDLYRQMNKQAPEEMRPSGIHEAATEP